MVLLIRVAALKETKRLDRTTALEVKDNTSGTGQAKLKSTESGNGKAKLYAARTLEEKDTASGTGLAKVMSVESGKAKAKVQAAGASEEARVDEKRRPSETRAKEHRILEGNPHGFFRPGLAFPDFPGRVAYTLGALELDTNVLGTSSCIIWVCICVAPGDTRVKLCAVGDTGLKTGWVSCVLR